MTPTPRTPKVVGLPRSRVRALRDGKALVVTEGGEPLIFNADGSLADVQLVFSAEPVVAYFPQRLVVASPDDAG